MKDGINDYAMKFIEQVVSERMDFIFPVLADFYCEKMFGKNNKPVLRNNQFSRLLEVGFKEQEWHAHESQVRAFIKKQAERDARKHGNTWQIIANDLLPLITDPFQRFREHFVSHVCEIAKNSRTLDQARTELEEFTWDNLSDEQKAKLQLSLSRRFLRILFTLQRTQEVDRARELVCQTMKKGELP